MSLERKDVRFKIDAETHADLALLADVDGLDLGEWVERAVLDAISRRVHAAERIAAARAKRGRNGE